MSCKYKNECPSSSGWCEAPEQNFERCIPFLISTVERVSEEAAKARDSPQVLYVCDRRACRSCNPKCHRTLDITHAENFKNLDGIMVEAVGEDDGI